MKGYILIAFAVGDLQLLKYDEELGDLVHIKTDSTLEHEMKVEHLECYPERNLFISASLDGHAKVWNIKKELIREIKFPESVQSATFLDDGCDILVGHQGRISLVSSKDYVPDEIKRLYAPTQEDMKNFC